MMFKWQLLYYIHEDKQIQKYTHLKHCIVWRVAVHILTHEMTTQKYSYDSNMVNPNIEENTIKMCSKIRAPSHNEIKCRSFDYHVKYFQINVTN